jgi:hypothetical protein
MRREEVVKGGRTELTRSFKAYLWVYPLPPGTKATIKGIECNDGFEDYVWLLFDGMSYYSFVPITSLKRI